MFILQRIRSGGFRSELSGKWLALSNPNGSVSKSVVHSMDTLQRESGKYFRDDSFLPKA
jgi:hypothetical protein